VRLDQKDGRLSLRKSPPKNERNWLKCLLIGRSPGGLPAAAGNWITLTGECAQLLLLARKLIQATHKQENTLRNML